MKKEEAADLDETRRLCYTLAVRIRREESPSSEMMATVANALLHHSDAVTDEQRIGLSGFLLGKRDLTNLPGFWSDLADACTVAMR